MAQIIFNKGDYFRAKNVHGVVLAENKAFMIGGGGRSGHVMTVGSIPDDALPCQTEGMQSEVRISLQSVRLVTAD